MDCSARVNPEIFGVCLDADRNRLTDVLQRTKPSLKVQVNMERHSAAEKLVPIGVVVDALHGEYPDVSHSSLRFLEREGLLRSTRTPGGHRLYSRADIDRVRRIKVWQAQRLSLSDIRERLEQLDHLPDPA